MSPKDFLQVSLQKVFNFNSRIAEWLDASINKNLNKTFDLFGEGLENCKMPPFGQPVAADTADDNASTNRKLDKTSDLLRKASAVEKFAVDIGKLAVKEVGQFAAANMAGNIAKGEMWLRLPFVIACGATRLTAKITRCKLDTSPKLSPKP